MKSLPIVSLLSGLTATLCWLFAATAAHAVSYGTPEGGWDFTYDGGPDFVDLFTHDNGSDAWDGSGLSDGAPGGVESFTRDGETFLRLVDVGNPNDHGFGEDPANRKIHFVRGMEFSADPLDFLAGGEGVTMYFRWRIVPGAEMEGIDVLPAGGGASFPWPDRGKGQTDIRFEGSGYIGIDTDFGTVNFSMDYADNSEWYEQDGLVMNDLIFPLGSPVPANSDSGQGGFGGQNVHPLQNLTDWQDLWVTIEPLDPGDFDNIGTNRVTVYANGDMVGQSYEVTAGTWNDPQTEAQMPAAIHFGPSYTDNYSAMDLDLFYVAPGIRTPVPPDPIDNRIPGDLDGDGDIDSADLNSVILNWTGALDPGTGTATSETGDMDGDMDVDTADLNTLILNWTGAKAGNLTDGADADLVYDPTTGDVCLDGSDTASGKIISFVLINDAGQMKPVADGRMPFVVTPVNTDNLPKQIGQADLTFQGVDMACLGPILPEGMTAEQLDEFFSRVQYASAPGVGGDLDLVVVPEPGAAWMVVLGLLSILRRLRQRR